jgi:DNA-binding NarL/FixJ family response regulator
VRGIYAGKTNQEIANQLFIALQTVKDHSSRVYQKTFVKNRAQLTTLIRETQNVS